MQLNELLERYRAASTNETEKGYYFERLVRVFLEYDDVQKQHYSAVVPFSEWAKEQGWGKTDTGIDLVATLADGSGYAAIQCKFYAPNHVIQKPDIDSFISASSNDLFTRLIIADTTQREFGRNTMETLDKLSKDWNRIGINELAASRIDWSQFLRTGNISLADKKTPKDHQREALKAVTEGLEETRPRQADHGLWHRQDLHRTADRRNYRRPGQVRVVHGPIACAHVSDRPRMEERRSGRLHRIFRLFGHQGGAQ